MTPQQERNARVFTRALYWAASKGNSQAEAEKFARWAIHHTDWTPTTDGGKDISEEQCEAGWYAYLLEIEQRS